MTTRRLNLFFVILSALLIMSVQSEAGDAGRESVFSVGIGAKAVGMGGGFTSLSHDGSSVYYNPAGLTLLSSQELSFMYLNLFEGSEFHFGSWVLPVGDRFGVGVGYMRVGTNDIIKRQNFVPLGTFSYSQSQFLFSLGYNTANRVSVGGTMKVVNQELDDRSDYSVAADAGMVIILPYKFRIGLAARDFIPAKFKLDDDDEKLPTTIAGGVGVDQISITENTKFSGTVEIEKAENRNEKLHAGGEFLFNDDYAIRAGYDRDNLALGLGCNISALSIDYAYKILDNIDNSHFFSLSYRLGAARDESVVTDEKASSKSTIEQEYARQFSFYKSKADDFFDRADFDSALVYYYKAMAFEPDNKDVKNSIAFIDKSREKPKLPQNDAGSIDRSAADRRLVGIYMAQGKNFYDKKFYLPALDLLEQVLAIDPDNKEADKLETKIRKELDDEIKGKMKAAKSAENSDELTKAVDSYTRVLELDPSHTDARQNRDRLIRKIGVSEKLYLGISQFVQNKYGQAKSQFETVLKYDSTNTVARSYLEQINKLLAEPTPLEVIQADGKVWPLYLEGLRFMREKQYQKAIDTWHQVLATYPNSINTINNIQQARLRLEAEKEN